MAVYFVNQGMTAAQERAGGYLWSPQRDKAGHRNAGYTNMESIHRGDFILHNNNSEIYAISVARTNCYDSIQPKELFIASDGAWDHEGYRVDCDYYVLDRPFSLSLTRDWFRENYNQDSAFDKNGKCKQQYMCHISKEHASYLLGLIYSLQNDSELRIILLDAMRDVV